MPMVLSNAVLEVLMARSPFSQVSKLIVFELTRNGRHAIGVPFIVLFFSIGPLLSLQIGAREAIALVFFR
jgi:hypothetical protein